TFVPASAAYPNRTSTSVERPRRSTSSNFTEFSPKTLLKAFDPQVWPLRECFGLQRKWWLHENWQQYGWGARLGEFSGSCSHADSHRCNPGADRIAAGCQCSGLAKGESSDW